MSLQYCCLSSPGATKGVPADLRSNNAQDEDALLALAWLERGVTAGLGGVAFASAEEFRALRDTPEFERIVADRVPI